MSRENEGPPAEEMKAPPAFWDVNICHTPSNSGQGEGVGWNLPAEVSGDLQSSIAFCILPFKKAHIVTETCFYVGKTKNWNLLSHNKITNKLKIETHTYIYIYVNIYIYI